MSHSVIPTASNNVPVTEHERFSPSVITTPSGKTVLDFGQNIAGYVAFSINAKAGQKLSLRFGEMLDKDGEFTQKNIQCANKQKTTPLQQVEYICRDGRNDYKTTFAIFGFQYVLVESDFAIDPADFTTIAVYSDMERTGWFESSNRLLDRFFDCTLWSAKNNHADLPTAPPGSATAGRETPRSSSIPPAASLTLRHFLKNISKMSTTGRSRTANCRKLHQKAVWTAT